MARDTVITEQPSLGEGPGFHWDEPLVIEGKGDGLTTGAWQIPPFLELLAGANSVTLDCLRAAKLDALAAAQPKALPPASERRQ